MPTCIPLTAKICDAPAREKSFFVLRLSFDLFAMQSAVHRAEDWVFRWFVNISAVLLLIFSAYVLTTLSLFFRGFSIVAQKYPKEVMDRNIITPFI
jgi:hypothetical protein